MCQFAGPYLGGGPLGDSAAAPVPECRQIYGFAVKMQYSSPFPASVRRDGREEIDPEVLKNGRGNCPYGAFLRRSGLFRAAKTGFLC